VVCSGTPAATNDCERCPFNFEPRTILEIADCSDRIELEFDLDSEAGRVNSLHKLDTLIAALRVFRGGIVAEFDEYDRRHPGTATPWPNGEARPCKARGRRFESARCL
jgi:hypothetical protein